MTKEQLALLLEVAEFLDGLCIGHPVADAQRHELAKRCYQAWINREESND